MKIIIAPDKFKGSLDAAEVCLCIKAGILKTYPAAQVYEYPMADGGDGFTKVLKQYLKTATRKCSTVDPLGRKILASYEWREQSKTAVIEMAAAAGLLLLKPAERDPLKTSTLGTGLMIKHAIDAGARQIILGAGGSATNDAGMGILQALGYRFFNERKQPLAPSGENLQHLKKLELPAGQIKFRLIIACDVQNKLFGKNGAAFVFAPQKGADDNAVDILDKGLRHFAAVIRLQTGKDVAHFNGAGAAGGIAAGLAAFLDIEITPGAALVTASTNIETQIKDADLVITGEGKLDEQTNSGKVVSHIAALGKLYRVPVIAICGGTTINQQKALAAGISRIVSLTGNAVTKQQAMKNAAALLTAAASKLIKGANGDW